MHVLITGGCGFVGFNVAAHLRDLGHKVTVFDNLARQGSETNLPNLRKLGIDFVHGDIRNVEDLGRLPTGIDTLIECSAQPSVVSGYQHPVYDFTTNVVGVINCLEFCRRSRTAMVFLSSSRVYSAAKINAIPRIELETRWDWPAELTPELCPEGFHPFRGVSGRFSLDGAEKTIYGASKAAADLFCQEYSDAFGLPVIVNRCGVIAGKGQFGVVGQGWLSHWAISCCFDRPIRYFGHKGKQVRDVLFVEDLCRLLSTQLERISILAGKVWNVGGGRDSSLSLIEATSMMERAFDKTMTTVYDEETRKGDLVIYITDNERIGDDLDWKPSIGLEEGVDSIARWVHDHRDTLIKSGL